MNKGTFFVILAPTGAGKTTIARELLKKIPEIARLVTVTTRPPRPGERINIDYHFVSENDFEHDKKANLFIETTVFGGFQYGSPKSVLEEVKKGKSFIAVMDRPGGIAVKNLLGPDAVLIWIAPPSAEELERRLRARNSESPEKLAERITIGNQEIAEEVTTKLGEATFVNDDLQTCVDEVERFIRGRL